MSTEEQAIPKTPIAVLALEGDQLSVMVTPVPLMRTSGIDPGLWSQAIAVFIKAAAHQHAAALTNESGEHPPVEDMLERIFEVLPEELEAQLGFAVDITAHLPEKGTDEAETVEDEPGS